LRFDNVPNKKDLFLTKKMASEKSGIFNWAIKGLERLLKNEQFSYDKTPEEVKRIMEMSGDPLIQFGNAVLLKEKGGRVNKQEMYEIYCIWANIEDKPLLSKEQLGRNLNQRVKYLISKKDKVRFWSGVGLKAEWYERLQEFTKKEDKIDTLDSF